MQRENPKGQSYTDPTPDITNTNEYIPHEYIPHDTSEILANSITHTEEISTRYDLFDEGWDSEHDIHLDRQSVPEDTSGYVEHKH